MADTGGGRTVTILSKFLFPVGTATVSFSSDNASDVRHPNPHRLLFGPQLVLSLRLCLRLVNDASSTDKGSAAAHGGVGYHLADIPLTDTELTLKVCLSPTLQYLIHVEIGSVKYPTKTHAHISSSHVRASTELLWP